MRAWYIREQKHILGTSDYAEVDLFETTDKEHTASTRRKRELATSIAQQKYNDMIARRYFCQLAYTNFGESDWAATFTYDHDHQPAPGDFDQVDRDWTNFTRRLKRFCKKTGREHPNGCRLQSTAWWTRTGKLPADTTIMRSCKAI